MGENRPLRPGTRRVGRNSYKVSTKFLEEDRERLGEEEFNRRMSYYTPKDKMKYGGMKKKKMKKKKVMKANQGVSVNFPEDHPDVEAQVKFINEQRMKKNKKYPKMARLKLPEQEYTKQQASRDLGKFAKRRSARLTATEGSFKTGGMSKARGTGCAIRGTNFKGIF